MKPNKGDSWHMKVLNGSTALAFMQKKHDSFDAYPSVENWDGVKLESHGQIFLSTTCSDRIGNAPTRFKHYMVNDMQSPPIHHAMCFEEWENSYPTKRVRNIPMGTTPHDNRKPPLYKVLSVLSSARSTFGSPTIQYRLDMEINCFLNLSYSDIHLTKILWNLAHLLASFRFI